MRPAIEEHGILKAVDNAVSRKQPTVGYDSLVAEGMQDMLFERVVLRHPDLFSELAVKRSQERLTAWSAE